MLLNKIMIRWLAAALLALSLGLAVSAQDDDEFTPSPALVEQMDLLEETTLRLRELERLAPVTRRFPTREDVAAYLEGELDDPELQAFYADARQFYIAFDFLPPDTDLLALLTDFLRDQIGGYYDPRINEMNTVMLSGERPGDRLPLTEQIVFVHEYTHALQQQHFDLLDLLLTYETSALGFNTDQGQAVLALIEGDATAVMTEYLLEVAQRNPFAALAEILAQGAASGTLTLPEGIPAIIEAELLMPYLAGEQFVAALRANGGWAMVNAAYQIVPQSTEQILHPEKYLQGDAPIPVTLAEDAALLDDGWALLFDRTLGEWFLRQYLLTQLPRAQASRAAAGWGGDRYHLYYDAAHDQRAWVLRLVWDTPDDGDEFIAAYTAFAGARFGQADAPAQPDADGCWHGADTICLLADDGAGGVLIAYGPTPAIAQSLIAGQVAVSVP